VGLGVDVFFGTVERANEKLVDAALLDPKASNHIKGAGFQWAGKRAIPGIHRGSRKLHASVPITADDDP
jgi:glucosylceramidase